MKKLIKHQAFFSLLAIIFYAATILFAVFLLRWSPMSVILASSAGTFLAVVFTDIFKTTKMISAFSIVETALADSVAISEGAQGVIYAIFTSAIFNIFLVKFGETVVTFAVLAALLAGAVIFFNGSIKRINSFLGIKKIQAALMLFLQYLFVLGAMQLAYSLLT
jgi:hypothetical protein